MLEVGRIAYGRRREMDGDVWKVDEFYTSDADDSSVGTCHQETLRSHGMNK